MLAAGLQIGRGLRARRWMIIAVSLTAALVGALLLISTLSEHDDLFVSSVLDRLTSKPDVEPAEQIIPTTSKYAFATFLSSDSQHPNGESNINKDVYYVGARILAYQLCHAPQTRSDIPYIVFVTPDVDQRKRKQLARDGAIVHEVALVEPGMVVTGVDAWQDVLTKLRLWEFTQFERIAFVDADVVLMRSLDKIFDDAAARPFKTRWKEEDRTHQDALPKSYVFASNAEQHRDHDWPPVSLVPWYFNAGLFIMRPDKKLFDYYMSLTHPEPPDDKLLFNTLLPEQNLLNWAHGINGSMPWHQIDKKWITHHTTARDLKGGAFAAHEHWWDPMHQDVEKYLVAQKAAMEAFFAAKYAEDESGL